MKISKNKFHQSEIENDLANSSVITHKSETLLAAEGNVVIRVFIRKR